MKPRWFRRDTTRMSQSQPFQTMNTNIWIINGETVPFFGMPYSTRMTVIRLSNGDLFVHSPVRLTPEIQNTLNELGPTRYLIAPNKIHHLFLKDYADVYPEAKMFAAPGLIKKRSDLQFFAELTDAPQPEWAQDIDQLVFVGSFAMQEVVFFHKSSKTLILTDLIENFDPSAVVGWFTKLKFKIAGVLAPDGKTPLDWRLTFWNRNKARQCLQKMIAWTPDRIILSHGLCVEKEGLPFLQQSFRWLMKPPS